MTELLTIETLANLVVLIFLQAVLGFDNLLYISIESKRAPEQYRKAVRYWGIVIAVALRVVLLFVMIALIDAFREPFLVFNLPGIIEGGVNYSTVVFIFGGIFIIYTAVREITHMLTIEHLGGEGAGKPTKTAFQVVAMIVFMNLIFSFDSILSAIAITDVFPVLAVAIAASGLAMLLLVNRVTEFIERNRAYEVLGLFILLIVGVVLIGEAGPAAAHAMHDESLQIRLFGYALLPMSKTTFYFAIVVLVAVEVIQTGYRRRLEAERLAAQGQPSTTH